MNKSRYFIAALLGLLLISCGGNKKHVKSPIDELIRDMDGNTTFEIILYDMEDNSGIFSSEYKHQYNIIREKDSVVIVDSTQRATLVKVPYKTKTAWYQVSSSFFKKNTDNMGMTLAYKDSTGKISKIPSPPGYNNYVGNSRYGHWGGGGFWQFYGQYMFMSSMFHMMSPISYGGYNNYRSNYYGRRPYYGSTTNGRPQYGTRSASSQRRMSNGSSRYGSSRRSSSGSRYSGSSTRSSGRSFGK